MTTTPHDPPENSPEARVAGTLEKLLSTAEDSAKRAAEAAEAAEKSASGAETARKQARNARRSALAVSGPTKFELLVDVLTLAVAAIAVYVAWSQLTQMNTDSRIQFSQSVFDDVSKQLTAFVSEPDVWKQFGMAEGQEAGRNADSPKATNLLLMLFNQYERYYVLKQQSKGLIAEPYWEEITTLVCETLNDPRYDHRVVQHLRIKLDEQEATASQRAKNISDPEGSVVASIQQRRKSNEEALEQLEECRP